MPQQIAKFVIHSKEVFNFASFNLLIFMSEKFIYPTQCTCICTVPRSVCTVSSLQCSLHYVSSTIGIGVCRSVFVIRQVKMGKFYAIFVRVGR